MINEKAIPEELKLKTAWVLWRYEKRNGKLTKPPYQPSGKPAESDNPATWSDYKTVLNTYRNGGGWDGIGYMLHDGLTGVDFDDCIDADGKVDPEIEEWIKLLDSYTEVSPSGKGFKTLLRGSLPAGGHHGKRIGVFAKKRYFCTTGRAISSTSPRIEPRQGELNEFVKHFWPGDFASKEREPTSASPPDMEKVKRAAAKDEKFSKLWAGDHSEYPSQSEADQALCCKLAYYFKCDFDTIDHLFRQSGLMRDKWAREDYRKRTIENAIELTEERIAIEQEGATGEDQAEEKPDSSQDCFLEKLTDADEDSAATYDWLIPQLVPKGEPMVIGGKGSTGKSTLALEFSARIMESDPEAGVVYICAEGTYRDTKIKARQMGLTRLDRFFFLKRKNGGTSFKLSAKEDLPLVTKTLEAAAAAGHKIVFVVIDSIRGMHRGSINDDAVGEVMQEINAEICGRLGITVCYIHHAKKNTQDGIAMDLFLGSVTVVNAIRYGLFMTKKTNRLREVEVAKSNLGHDDIFWNAEMTPDHRIQLTYAGVRGDDADQGDLNQVDKAEEIILSMLHGGEPVPAYLIYSAGEREGICDKTMKRAKRLRGVDSFQQGKRWFWRLPASELEKIQVGSCGPSGPPGALDAENI
jgi:hypothetical protein